MGREKSICCFCRLPRAERDCPICREDVCRSCVETLSDDAFELMREKPEELSHAQYCPRCFDAVVQPARDVYNETFERAKNVGFWARAYKGYVPVLSKALEEVSVSGCRGRDEALLKLGFMAAELGYNGLIHGELLSKKVRHHGYQKMEWSGRALPCKVDEAKLERDELNEAHWRTLHHR